MTPIIRRTFRRLKRRPASGSRSNKVESQSRGRPRLRPPLLELCQSRSLRQSERLERLCCVRHPRAPQMPDGGTDGWVAGLSSILSDTEAGIVHAARFR
jgi:hypothetical protein